MKAAVCFCVFVLFIISHTFPLHAQWQENGVPVATVTNDEEWSEIASDGCGGAIIVWQTYYSYKNSPDIYAQRVDGDGYLLWPVGGAVVCTAAEGQYKPQIVSDGAGGAIIAWSDFRNGNADIYAQRVDPGGNPLWTVDGMPICTVQDSFGWWERSRVSMLEYPGGAIMTWHDDRNGNFDIYAQRIDTSGAVLWTPNGVAVCTESGRQARARICTDGVGGAIIVWQDLRGIDEDIYAQRIDADSVVQWTAGGVPVCVAANDQSYLEVTSDHAGGAICTWHDARGADDDIYAQRIGGDGVSQWATDGIPVCVDSNVQWFPQLAPDGYGGAIITWEDRRDAVWYEHDIYAQRITAAGDTAWQANGIRIRAYGGGWDNAIPTIVADGYGGAIISWFTTAPLPKNHGIMPNGSLREDIESIYIQRIAGDGTIWWQDGGVTLVHLPCCYSPLYPRLIADGAGGAIVSWWNHYDSCGIYAQRVNGFGNAPPTEAHTPPPSFTLFQNYPNPFNPSTAIRFYLPRPVHVKLTVYNVKGELVATLVDGYMSEGQKEVAWSAKGDGGGVVASGIYFYRIEAGDFTQTRKMVLLR